MKKITKSPIISIIIPCFNGAQFIKKIILQIKNQTLSNFECIIVDDGSTDNSFEIIKECIDSRFLLLKNQTNIGLKLSRKKAFEVAVGKYITAIDCDDQISNNFLEKLVEIMEKTNLDICFSNYQLVDSNLKQIKYGKSENKLKKTIPFLSQKNKKYLLSRRYGAWSQVFLKTFLVDLKYNYSGSEIELFSFAFYENARVGYCNESIYYFIRHSNSTSSLTKAPKRIALEMKGKKFDFAFPFLSKVSPVIMRTFMIYVFRVHFPLLFYRSLADSEYKWKSDYLILKKTCLINFCPIISNLIYFSFTNKVILFFCAIKLEKMLFFILKNKYNK